MSEKMQIVLLGICCFAAGIFILFRHKSLAKQMAERVKTNVAQVKLYARFVKWSRFDYSEEYYRLSYKFGGIFSIAAGVLLFVSALFGGKEHAPESVGSYVLLALIVSIMLCGFVFILYVGYKFGNKK